MCEFVRPWLTGVEQVECLPLDEPPVAGLLRLLEERRVDVTVLGSRGRGVPQRAALGSIPEAVLRETRSPLLIARQRLDQDEPRARIGRLLCPVNQTPAASEALRVAESLARRLDARLTVLHALEEDEDAAEVRDQVCAWAGEHLQTECAWEMAPLERGPAAESIVRSAGQLGADLIVLAGRQRPFLTASLLGATTERVARHAPCSVLTVVTS
jgi:nucleotide-binding universal stress UspA family protein